MPESALINWRTGVTRERAMKQVPTIEELRRMSPDKLAATGMVVFEGCDFCLGQLELLNGDLDVTYAVCEAWAILSAAYQERKSDIERARPQSWPDGTIRNGPPPGEPNGNDDD